MFKDRVVIIGLTGGIACGKSTVSAHLKQLGAEIIDGDLIAREITNLPEVIEELSLAFGTKVINIDKTLNRRELASIVFSNETALEKLNSITHPKIEKSIEFTIQHYKEQNNDGVIILDIPLLIETKMCHKFNIDELWLVSISRDIQLKRLMDRNGYSVEEAERRINSQMTLEEKKKFADVIIDNSFDIDHLYMQIDENFKRVSCEGRAYING